MENRDILVIVVVVFLGTLVLVHQDILDTQVRMELLLQVDIQVNLVIQGTLDILDTQDQIHYYLPLKQIQIIHYLLVMQEQA